MPLLSPQSRDRLVYHLDRPLGFYVTLALCALAAVGMWDMAGPVFGHWPAMLRSAVGVVAMLLFICAGVVLLWMLRTICVALLLGIRRLLSR